MTTRTRSRLKVALTLMFLGTFSLGGIVTASFLHPYGIGAQLMHLAAAGVSAFVCYIGFVRATNCA